MFFLRAAYQSINRFCIALDFVCCLLSISIKWRKRRIADRKAKTKEYIFHMTDGLKETSQHQFGDTRIVIFILSISQQRRSLEFRLDIFGSTHCVRLQKSFPTFFMLVTCLRETVPISQPSLTADLSLFSRLIYFQMIYTLAAWFVMEIPSHLLPCTRKQFNINGMEYPFLRPHALSHVYLCNIGNISRRWSFLIANWG